VSIVSQVIACPVCGASRKLPEYGIDSQGNLAKLIDRPLLLKIQHNLGRSNIQWEEHDLPLAPLRALILNLEHALARAKQRLAEMPDEG
jgi:hypothetical protein